MEPKAEDLIPHLATLFALTTDHLFTTAQARAAGFGPAELRALVRAGIIRRIIRGWYAAPSGFGEPPPWVDPDPFAAERAQHRLLITALLRSFEGRVVASHHSALILHNVEMWRSDLRTAHVCRATDDHTRHRARAIIHPACGVPPIEIDGLLTVPVEVAIVQVGLLRGAGGLRFPLESLVTADNALYQDLVTPSDLKAAVALHEGVPGINAVRGMLARADGRHESVGETRLFHNLGLLGYNIEPQRKVCIGKRVYRVDGKLRDHSVYVEFDGMSKYLPARPLTTEDEVAARRRLAAEKDRQDSIGEASDCEFVRFTWDELDHLREMDRRMQAAIRRATRRGA